MIFDKTIKMADLVLQNPDLLIVTERFGMSLGFKRKSVEEVCKENKINSDVFFLIIGLYQNSDEELCLNLINKDVVQIVEYLEKSHEYYTQEALPKITKQIKLLTDENEDLSLKMIEQFFDQYVHEVNVHLAYEENNVYPYALTMLQEQNSSVLSYSIAEYKKNHNDIETKLDDLKNLLIRHLPGDTNVSFRREILLDLFRFEEDLFTHTIIEERILIPYISQIECQMHNKEK